MFQPRLVYAQNECASQLCAVSFAVIDRYERRCINTHSNIKLPGNSICFILSVSKGVVNFCKEQCEEINFLKVQSSFERHIPPALGSRRISGTRTVLLELNIDHFLQQGSLNGSGGLSVKRRKKTCVITLI